jgi:NAD(P)-dependent dehydrogenase (short-subunit alcohol dehydrogenase family)
MTAKQHPIGTGFTAATDAAEVLAGVDLTGMNVIVTGGTAGLGRQAARALAGAGANVTAASRREGGLDLLDPASIDAFAERYLASRRPLHILINNAAIAQRERVLDARGYEAMLAANHLGHFQLTRALRPALAAVEGARVVAVSSAAHRASGIRWDDPQHARDFDSTMAYAQSKTANILHAVELDRRWSADGIRGFALHPGIVGTYPDPDHPSEADIRAAGAEIDEHLAPLVVRAADKKTPQQAAATIVFGAASPLLAGLGGVYLKDSDVGRIDPAPGVAGADGVLSTDVAPHAVDPTAAARLWELSEELLLRGPGQPA